MNDLSKPWPFGLDSRRWWMPVGGMLVLLAVAFGIDHQMVETAAAWPVAIRDILEQATRYGESDWILYPAAALYVVTAALALLSRWKLMRTMLWQFGALYAFVLVGVGAPSLLATLLKNLVGRARPMHFADAGLLAFHPNWLDWTYQGFPSGHTTTAFALATVLGFLSPRWFRPALGLAVVIGLSRISVGMHYPSDVVGGAILGVLGAYTARWLFAQRRWVFRVLPDGRIVSRPVVTLRRYIDLRRQRTGKVPQPGRP